MNPKQRKVERKHRKRRQRLREKRREQAMTAGGVRPAPARR
jgi:hypothetical protein